MFSSMTFKVSSRMTNMTCHCVNAILLFTSLFANTVLMAPTLSSEHAQYIEVLHHSQHLMDIHHEIYNQYRLQRFQFQEIVLTTMKIEGFPNFRNISQSQRYNPSIISPADLTITDRRYLGLLLTAMRHVEIDEGLYPGSELTGFLQDFRDIISNLEVLIANLDSWIALKGIEGTDHLAVGTDLQWPEVQEFERTLHALYILQEMDQFLHTFRTDFVTLFQAPS